MTATQESKQELEAALNLKFDANGLIAAVIQDATNDQVLMVGYMNEEAFRRTLATRRVTFWSRSRQKYWVKGETSGNVQNVIDLYVDCDQDCLLVKVEQTGAACHEGYRSCFFRRVKEDAFQQDNGPENQLEPVRLDVIDSPLVNPY